MPPDHAERDPIKNLDVPGKEPLDCFHLIGKIKNSHHTPFLSLFIFGCRHCQVCYRLYLLGFSKRGIAVEK